MKTLLALLVLLCIAGKYEVNKQTTTVKHDGIIDEVIASDVITKNTMIYAKQQEQFNITQSKLDEIINRLMGRLMEQKGNTNGRKTVGNKNNSSRMLNNNRADIDRDDGICQRGDKHQSSNE